MWQSADKHMMWTWYVVFGHICGLQKRNFLYFILATGLELDLLRSIFFSIGQQWAVWQIWVKHKKFEGDRYSRALVVTTFIWSCVCKVLSLAPSSAVTEPFSHSTCSPMNLWTDPNRCFWIISQLSQSFVAAVPTCSKHVKSEWTYIQKNPGGFCYLFWFHLLSSHYVASRLY